MFRIECECQREVADLSGLRLRDEEAIEVCCRLSEKNSAVRALDLSYNEIGPRGAQAIAALLQTNTTLTLLRLNGNRIGDDGADFLSPVVLTNSTLQVLTIQLNNMRTRRSLQHVEAMQQSVAENEVVASKNGKNVVRARCVLFCFESLFDETLRVLPAETNLAYLPPPILRIVVEEIGRHTIPSRFRKGGGDGEKKGREEEGEGGKKMK